MTEHSDGAATVLKDRLDLTGLKCPMPALLARRALLRASTGTAIEVIADDPLAHIDLPHMCAQEGFEMVSLSRAGGITRIVLRR